MAPFTMAHGKTISKKVKEKKFGTREKVNTQAISPKERKLAEASTPRTEMSTKEILLMESSKERASTIS